MIAYFDPVSPAAVDPHGKIRAGSPDEWKYCRRLLEGTRGSRGSLCRGDAKTKTKRGTSYFLSSTHDGHPFVIHFAW